MSNCFNSNLVQLKDRIVPHRNFHFQSFNSNLVQLKERVTKQTLNAVDSFNSNLVQLKEYYFYKYLCYCRVLIPIWYN
ncbi:Uncharacterised protein [Porphyromonas macacae]|uniref:Uncharacterized protein n=1 Tax=Porphyromonas macacae TaxID=28115 RepID=A0A379E8Y7_9PORP|nr:Uncharacterised protein [Porphyromonas macacae]